MLSRGSKNKYGRHVAIFEIEQKINRHTCWPSQAFSLHQVWKKSSWCCSSYGPKCVYTQDGRQAAILNDIKNLFDVHNPQTIADLVVKFQTIWSIHFWEIAVYVKPQAHVRPKRCDWRASIGCDWSDAIDVRVFPRTCMRSFHDAGP